MYMALMPSFGEIPIPGAAGAALQAAVPEQDALSSCWRGSTGRHSDEMLPLRGKLENKTSLE